MIMDVLNCENSFEQYCIERFRELTSDILIKLYNALVNFVSDKKNEGSLMMEEALCMLELVIDERVRRGI